MSSPSTNVTTSAPRLRRTLTLSDLILYGIIVIQPVAPMSVFGVLSDRGRGHVVTTLLIAMVAMLFTAFSYGRRARAYPSAGSAFAYVGQEINPALGYVTGWSMVMDYMLNPMICIVWCSQQAHVFAPGVPYWTWALFFGAVFTFLNIQGIKTSARVNTLLAAGLTAVLGLQTLVIVGGNLKVIPLTGVTLPFISYGGSSLLANFVILGILLRMSHEEARHRYEVWSERSSA